MEITLYNIHIQFPFRGCQEYSLVNFKLFLLASPFVIIYNFLLTFSTPLPYTCLNVQAIRVFFPAPLGP